MRTVITLAHWNDIRAERDPISVCESLIAAIKHLGAAERDIMEFLLLVRAV